MELDPASFEAGLWGLFLAAFLAATVLPFSSEAVFLSFLALDYNAAQVLIVSSAGNCLGGMASFALGWLVPADRIPRWFGADPERVRTWAQKMRPKGAIWGLLCWLPIVGDLIAVALGSIRVSPSLTAIFMAIGKTSRYALILWVWHQTQG